MTILQIFSRYVERGGEEIAIERIGEVLAESYKVESCFFDNAEWTRDSGPWIWSQPWLMIHNPKALHQLCRRQKEVRADAWLVHNIFPVGSAGIFREAQQLRVPVIYYVHNFRPFSVGGSLWAGGQITPDGLRGSFWKEIYHGAWQDSKIKTAWLAFVLRLTHWCGWWNSINAWITVSDFVRDKFIEAGIPSVKIFTLRPPWRPMKKLPVPKDDGYYLYLGRLIEEKGVQILPKTWSLLKQRLGAKTPKLVIAGAGNLAESVRSACANDSNMSYVGSVSGQQKCDLLAGCRGVIVPSLWWEPLCLTTYEAYDFGKPMLAASSGGLTEVVVAEQTGKLHEPGNFHQLADHIVELEADPDKRAKMGSRAREWLLTNTNEDEWRKQFTSIVKFVTDAQRY